METLTGFKKTQAAELFHNPASGHHPADTYFHFSFANYHDPKRMNFGALRVLNDDVVSPHNGFGMHPHKNMEIVTYLVSGKLTHQDRMGNLESISKGSVQFMSAGTGVTHSEMNQQDEPCRLLQIWIPPDELGVEPRYGSVEYDPAQRRNQWLTIAGGRGNQPEAKVQLYQDVAILVTELDAGQSLDFELKEGRQAYLYAIEGSASVNGIKFETRDSLEMREEQTLQMKAEESGAHLILFEMEK